MVALDERDSCMVLEETDVAEYPDIEAAPMRYEISHVPIDSIQPADSPRLSGVSIEHARLLKEQMSEFPAIIVNQRTMQVVDGMHRLSAAKLQGAETIRVQFVDMDQHEAFVLAVRTNIEHGLPLSLADREAAAIRILEWYPLWSDRAIAQVVGLAPSTLAAIRGRSTGHSQHSNMRMGRDGRIRPMTTLDGRMRASEILTARPQTPLREVAAEAGVSLGTAHDVRDRMRRGEDPVPDRLRGQADRTEAQCPQQAHRRRRRRCDPVTWASIRQRLVKDPTLRYVTSGRELLRWFDLHAVDGGSLQSLVAAIPPRWADAMMGMAYSCGDEWFELAGALERRAAALNNTTAYRIPRGRAEDGVA